MSDDVPEMTVEIDVDADAFCDAISELRDAIRYLEGTEITISTGFGETIIPASDLVTLECEVGATPITDVDAVSEAERAADTLATELIRTDHHD